MIEIHTNSPALTIEVYAQWEIEEREPPQGRFVVVSITDTDRRDRLADLTKLGAIPVLRLNFHVGGPPKGLSDEQAGRFWEFIQSNLTGLDTILLHCGAGAIRSPALALALIGAFGGDERPLLADSEPDTAAYLTAVRAFPRVFGRPFLAGED